MDGTRILVSDFGLARSEDDARLTRDSEIVGPEFYIAPELEGGYSPGVDHRPADFYSFGKLIWATMSKRRALSREEHCVDPWTLVVQFNDPRFKHLDLLLKDLAKVDPSVRLRDWGAVMEELESFQKLQENEPVSRPKGFDSDRIILGARRLAVCAPAVSANKIAQLREEELARKQLFIRAIHGSVTEPLQQIIGMINGHISNIANFNFSVGDSTFAHQDVRGGVLVSLLTESGAPAHLVGQLSSQAWLICTHYTRPANAAAVGAGAIYDKDEFWLFKAASLDYGDPPNTSFTRLRQQPFEAILGPFDLRSRKAERAIEAFVEDFSSTCEEFIMNCQQILTEDRLPLHSTEAWARPEE